METLEFFTERVRGLSETREDVKTWFDYLDLDDHVTFGGKGNRRALICGLLIQLDGSLEMFLRVLKATSDTCISAYWPHPTENLVKDVLDAALAERSGPRSLPRPAFTRSAT